MIKIILVFGVALMATGALGEPSLKLKIAYGPVSEMGETYFMSIPVTAESARSENYNWTDYNCPDSNRNDLFLLCARDNVSVCGLYDKNGKIGGLQIAIEKSKFHDSVLDWTIQGYKNWSVTVNGVTREFWCMYHYYVSDEYLALDSADRNSIYNSSSVLQNNALWVSGFNGELVKLPTTSTELMNMGFTEHNCISWMGTHYYYNLTIATECTSLGIFPWAPLTNSGKLIGIALNIVGQLTLDTDEKDYFEHFSLLEIMPVFKKAPDCLLSWANSPGFTTIHTYFVSHPETITCS